MAQPTELSSVVPVDERSWLRAVGPHALVVLALCAFTVQVHFRLEYALLTIFWAVLAFGGARARRFAKVAFPVLVVGVLYEQIVPRLLPYRPEVHVASFYNLEVALFGIPSEGGRIIPSEWFARHTTPLLDLACGVGYLAYMFETFLVIGFLYLIRDEERSLRLSSAFLICNMIGMSIWLMVPVAPPWYVAEHGLGPAMLHAHASPAGAARFDALIGIPYFAGFYARSHNVHGAMPSLHAAYPAVVAAALWTRSRLARWSAVAFAALVALAAVYLYHHYVVDVVAGVATALAAWAILVWMKPEPNRVRDRHA